jgi:hypothetical protein
LVLVTMQSRDAAEVNHVAEPSADAGSPDELGSIKSGSRIRWRFQ